MMYVQGENDKWLSKDLLYNTDRWVPDLTVKYLKGSHWIAQDNPKEVNAAIRQFIA